MSLCPSCRSEIPVADVNVGEGVAVCRACGTLCRVSEIAEDLNVRKRVDDKTPRGCVFLYDGDTYRISCPTAGPLYRFAILYLTVFIFVMPFMFIGIALWNNPSLLPFALLLVYIITSAVGSCGLLAVTIYLLFGRIIIYVRDRDGVIKSKVGPFSLARRFDIQLVKSICIVEGRWKARSGAKNKYIVLAATRDYRIGGYLSDKQRSWLAVTLRAVLLDPSRR